MHVYQWWWPDPEVLCSYNADIELKHRPLNTILTRCNQDDDHNICIFTLLVFNQTRWVPQLNLMGSIIMVIVDYSKYDTLINDKITIYIVLQLLPLYLYRSYLTEQPTATQVINDNNSIIATTLFCQQNIINRYQILWEYFHGWLTYN